MLLYTVEQNAVVMDDVLAEQSACTIQLYLAVGSSESTKNNCLYCGLLLSGPAIWCYLLLVAKWCCLFHNFNNWLWLFSVVLVWQNCRLVEPAPDPQQLCLSGSHGNSAFFPLASALSNVSDGPCFSTPVVFPYTSYASVLNTFQFVYIPHLWVSDGCAIFHFEFY